jgi:hypothetical protein
LRERGDRKGETEKGGEEGERGAGRQECKEKRRAGREEGR